MPLYRQSKIASSGKITFLSGKEIKTMGIKSFGVKIKNDGTYKVHYKGLKPNNSTVTYIEEIP